jgi:hypothetical protein
MSNVLRMSIAFSILSAALSAHGAEFEAHPALAVSEEFTDNVFETTSNRTSDYITRALPEIAMSYRAPALTGDFRYLFDYRHYAKNNHKDEITYSLSTKGLITAVENFVYLDVSDEYQRVSLDVTRDVTKESLFINQADRNVATISPYLKFRPIERILVKPGYRFIDTRYFSSSGIDKNNNMAYVDVAYEWTKRFNLTAAYTFNRETSSVGNYDQHQTLEGFRYEYADKSFVFAQVGFNWIEYDRGPKLKSIAWNAGITHVFDTVTGTVTTGVRYNEDPLSNAVQESFVGAYLEKRFNRGLCSLSSQYSEFLLTSTDTLQTRKYGATVRGQYEFTKQLNGTFGFNAERYEQPLAGSYTRRLQVDSGLSYLLAQQLIASLSYVYTGYYSPGIAGDNKDVNRAIIEVKKIF